MAQEAFDLAERLQTPVFVLSDLDLGMNNWMSDPFPYPTAPLASRQGARRGGHRQGEGHVGPLQGRRRRRHPVPHAARHEQPVRRVLHARLRPQREGAVLREAAATTSTTSTASRGSSRRRARWCRSRRSRTGPGARAGILAYGTSHYGTSEARDKLRGDVRRPARLLPAPRAPVRPPRPRAWIRRHDRIYVVEQNRDAQLVTILRDELPELAARFVSIRQYNGLPLDATTVVEGVLQDRAPKTGRKG